VNDDTQIKVLSLFSGVGGFDLGLEQAGMQTVYQCEYDKHATKVLERHWPTVPRWGDITTLTGREVLRHAPEIDLVAWGSPCQDLSVAGKRSGLNGARSGLFYHGMRIIKEIREATNGRYPRISVWENVVGALNSNRGADFGSVLDAMAKAGALVIEWRVLDAQYFGVPQRRRRVFVVSVFDPATAARCPDPLLPVEEGVRRDTAQGETARQGAASEVAGGAGSSGEVAGCLTWRMGRGLNGQDAYSNLLEVVEKDEHQRTVGPVTTHMSSPRGTETSDSEHLVVGSSQGRADSPDARRERLLGSDIVGSLNAVDYKWVQNQQVDENKLVAYSFDSLASNSMKSNNPHSGVREVDVSKTLDTTRPDPSCNQGGIGIVAPSLTAANDPSRSPQASEVTQQVAAVVEASMTVRRLMPIECERLMGWPDDWTVGQSDSHRYKQCGNGVASPVAEWIGQCLSEVL
jgi:DNA (cytosine-5)-methyltransferase 1